MGIFNGFLIILVAVLLFMLPFTGAIYDFRTEVEEDTFNYATAANVTTGNVTLQEEVYDDDTDTIGISSDLTGDVPLFSAYNTTTRLLDMTGLLESSNRTLTVEYDTNALSDNAALDTLLSWVPYIWIMLVCGLPIAALYVYIRGRTR
jgi:hypothetical protein